MSALAPGRTRETDIQVSDMYSMQRPSQTTSAQILASICPSEPPILELFEAVVSNLWSIWECVVLSEPILVFGPSPSMTSRAVWWLRDLLRPVSLLELLLYSLLTQLSAMQIPLSGDFRPFFTIHDADHTAIVNPRPPQAGLLVGVTNPFFEKACRHWPNVLSLGRQPT